MADKSNGYDPAPLEKPAEINVPLKNEPTGQTPPASPNEFGGEVNGRGRDIPKP